MHSMAWHAMKRPPLPLITKPHDIPLLFAFAWPMWTSPRVQTFSEDLGLLQYSVGRDENRDALRVVSVNQEFLISNALLVAVNFDSSVDAMTGHLSCHSEHGFWV
jgi:hypothetical protein